MNQSVWPKSSCQRSLYARNEINCIEMKIKDFIISLFIAVAGANENKSAKINAPTESRATTNILKNELGSNIICYYSNWAYKRLGIASFIK